ncbi:MAG TPA: hypothetical protein VD858_15400 [Reyranella sp.]|nr:hypothetical protein [Reyranella sp.]
MMALVVAAGCKSEDEGGGDMPAGGTSAGMDAPGDGDGDGDGDEAGEGGAAGTNDSGGAGGTVAAGSGGTDAAGAGGAGTGGAGGAAGMALDFPDPRNGCPELDSGFVGDEACLAPPPEDEGFQIHIGPEDYANPGKWEVAIDEENSWCANFHLPNTEEVYYQGFVLSGRPGTHHIINTAYVPTVTLVDGELGMICMDGGTGSNSNIFDNLPGASKAYMPRKLAAPENAGLGRKLEPMLPAQADMHYFNFTEGPLLREFWLNLYYIPKEDVKETAKQIRGMGGIGWQIEPGSNKTWQYQCPIDAPGRIVSLLGHYHAHGKRFAAYLQKGDGSQKKVFEMYDYNDPAEFQYDSVAMNPAFSAMKAGAVSGTLEVEAGDMLQWECHIVNDSDVTLDYSNKVKNGEMCNLWGATVGPKVNCVHFLAEQPFTIQ